MVGDLIMILMDAAKILVAFNLPFITIHELTQDDQNIDENRIALVWMDI